MSKAKKIIILIGLIVTLVIPFGITASADVGDVYYLPFTQPTVNENDGFIEVLMKNPNTGKKIVYIYFWRLCSTVYPSMDNGVKPTMRLNVTSDSITYSYHFSALATDEDTYFSFIEGLATEQGVYDTWLRHSYNSMHFDYKFWKPDEYDIIGLKSYGNAEIVTNSIDQYGENGGAWSVTYGGDTVIASKLDTIISIFSGLNNDDIIANQDKNSSEIQKNDDENTQAIIDNQNDLAEKEKTETQNQGEGSVNDVSGAIEDKSAGFISSIGNLVSAMSYNGTSCAWKFPALKLPAIDGVMSEIKLTDEKPIDFEYWVNKIPSNVLLLVRSVLTIALIVYCFKELYNTISYVLTLKGGGNDE